MVGSQDVPQLIVLAPNSDQVRRIELRQHYMVVGREPACDVRFDDPYVSRTHAALQRRGNAVYVSDLGSSGGTFIGGTAVTTARELHPGDVVTFATVAARFEPASITGDTLAAPAAARARSYLEAVREIAVARARALWLGWIGVLVFAEGLMITSDTHSGFFWRTDGAGLGARVAGPDIAGIPAGMLGLTLVAAGILLLTTGIGLHIVASLRRRRARCTWTVGRRPGFRRVSI